MSVGAGTALHRPSRVLVISAHPGAADLGMAGTVAGWVSQGTVAYLVCVTSGEAGSDQATTDPLELAAVREAEQRAAAELVGYQDVAFLHRPDGAVANDLALREQLVRIIRSFRPDTVASSDPRVLLGEDGSIQHIDHRETGAAAVDAVYPAAGSAMTFPHLVKAEGLAPHTVERVYLFWSDRPSAWVDISDTIETKLAALRAHASQGRRSAPPAPDVRAWARRAGEPVGLDAAESCAVIELPH